MLILTLLDPKHQTPLKQWRFKQESLISIGRAPDNHVVLTNSLVSRRHLELQRTSEVVRSTITQTQFHWQLTNYSTNGTFIDGCRVAIGQLSNGCLLQLAQGGPQLHVQIVEDLSIHTVEGAIQLPKIPKLYRINPLSNQQSSPPAPCTHAGNVTANLFCVHCGQPITVEKTIRQYQVLRILGQGGMGITYLVWNSHLESAISEQQGQLLVLKEMNATIAHISKAQELFEREANTLKLLNHPGIPKFYDFFVEGGKKYLVMELLHGQDLEKRVLENGPISPRQAIVWMIQTCEVLEYLHNRPVPIIHRDIKPGNLLVQTLNNQIVVLDFGAVKAVGMPSGTRIGAEGFCAPEQTQGRPVPQSDLYAIGPSLFFLLTGKHPQRFYKKLNGGYRFVPEQAAIAPEVQRVITQVTEPDLGRRYQTARGLARALATCL